MEYTQLLCIISFVVPILLLLFGLLKYYEPKIDVIVTKGSFEIRLLYNWYEKSEYKGRTYRSFFIEFYKWRKD